MNLIYKNSLLRNKLEMAAVVTLAFFTTLADSLRFNYYHARVSTNILRELHILFLSVNLF